MGNINTKPQSTILVTHMQQAIIFKAQALKESKEPNGWSEHDQEPSQGSINHQYSNITRFFYNRLFFLR